jgi:hypothetical protein
MPDSLTTADLAREYVEDRFRFLDIKGCSIYLDNRCIRLSAMSDKDAVLVAEHLRSEKMRREALWNAHSHI